jgi:hypothetical protein
LISLIGGIVVEQIGKCRDAGGEMLRDRAFGDAEPRDDFGERKTLNFPHHHDLPPARRQAFEGCLQLAQILSRDGRAFGAGLVDTDAQRFEIGDGFDGDNLRASHAVGEHVARDDEGERPRGGGNFLEGCFVDGDIDVLTQIADVGFVAPSPAQEFPKGRFQRQNLADKPVVYARGHG